MEDPQIERIFSMLSDIDRRFVGRLDYIADHLSSLKSEVSALSAWRDSWNLTWSAEQARNIAFENRLRTIESKHPELENIIKVQEDLAKRVYGLEKTITKAAAVWATISFIGGVGLQLFIHFVLRVN